MPIDPDVQPLLDDLDARVSALEALEPSDPGDTMPHTHPEFAPLAHPHDYAATAHAHPEGTHTHSEFALAGHSHGTGGTSQARDGGERYVHPGGSDANNGLTWDTAKKTIQAAHDSLPPTGAGSVGGRIILANGVHAPQPAVINKLGTIIQGQGIGATRLDVGSGQIALQFKADRCTVQDLEIQDISSGRTAQGGVWLGAKYCVADNVAFNEIGKDVAAGGAFDTAPYAIRCGGNPQRFADWLKLNKIHIRSSYRGVFVDGGCNGFAVQVDIFGSMKRPAIDVMRRTIPGAVSGVGDDVTFQWHQVWVAGGTAGGYQIAIDCQISQRDTSQIFDGLVLERSAATSSGNHIWVNANKNMFDKVVFSGGPEAIRFTNLASYNQVGMRVLTAQGAGTPAFHNAGTNNTY